jgi:hypothetical protein
MIHQFELDDNNSGQIYLMSLKTTLDVLDCLKYLQQFSRYVAHIKTKDKQGKKQKGFRQLPIGTIVDYRWRLDCCNTFGGAKKTREGLKV